MQFLERCYRFLWEWVRLLVFAGKWLGITIRMGLIVSGITGGLTDFTLVEKMTIWWGFPNYFAWSITVSLWLLVPIVIGVGYGMVAFGVALVLSCRPYLKMGSRLESDNQNRMYRLRITNVGGRPAEPKVNTNKVIAEDGVPLIPPANLPMELHWSHHPRGTRAVLFAKESATVGLVMRAGNPERLWLTQVGVDYPIDASTSWQNRRTVYFELCARCLNVGSKALIKWFALQPDDCSPIGYSLVPEERVTGHIKDMKRRHLL